MRSCFMLRILPVAYICFFGLPILSTADNRISDNDIPLTVRDEEEQNSSDLGLQSATVLLDLIEQLLDRLDDSAIPPQDDESAPETSWPPLENDFLSRDHVYLPKSSSNAALRLSMTSYAKSQRSSCSNGFLCRVIRGRQRGNANAGARALPFGKRSSTRNSEDTSSVRGRRRGRGRPGRSRGATHGFPQQNKLPFGKRRV